MLLQLQAQGYEIMRLGTTIFDAEKGVYYVNRAWAVGQTHHALATSTQRLMEVFAPSSTKNRVIEKQDMKKMYMKFP